MMGFFMKKIKQVDDKLQKEKAEKERIEKLQREHAEKLQKEYAAKVAAQKKWLDSLEYPHEIHNPASSQEDFFVSYWKENNNRIIER
jgi:hypothetical protein